MRSRTLLTTILALALPLVPSASAADPLTCAEERIDHGYYALWWENATSLREGGTNATFALVEQLHVPDNATNATAQPNSTLPHDPVPSPPFLDLAGKLNATPAALEHASNVGRARECLAEALGAEETVERASKEAGRLANETVGRDPVGDIGRAVFEIEQQIECAVWSALDQHPPVCEPQDEDASRSVAP